MLVNEIMVLIIGTVVTAIFFFIVTGNHSIKVSIIDTDSDEIMRMIARGKTTKEIAFEMNITANAINKHINKLKKEYNCTTRDQFLCAWALSGKLRKHSDNSQ